MVSLTEALVLRLSDYGESDRIVTLFTLSEGKITAIAKGAKQSRKRFGGALSIFGFGEAKLRERKGSDLWILEEFQSVRGFSRLSQEMGRFGQASYATELCKELCPSHLPEPQIFLWLRLLLERLNGLPLEVKPRPEWLMAFELKLLQLVGFQMSLSFCAGCGRGPDIVTFSHEEKTLFVPQRGGVLCFSCSRHSPVTAKSDVWISKDVYDALVYLSQEETFFTESFLPLFTKEVLVSCREILLLILQQFIGKSLKTIDFIRQINQFG